MTTALALEYIPRRMRELGHGSDYYIRFRHFVLLPNEVVELEAYNQYYLLVEEPEHVKIKSDFGFYDLSEDKTNEQFYEHQGAIVLTNYAPTVTHVRFIQVIPLTGKKK
jgi:hypothetical protein